MARGAGCEQQGNTTSAGVARPRTGTVPAELTSLSYEDIQSSTRFAAREDVSPWRGPGDFEWDQAVEFVSRMAAQGITLDPTIAYELFKQRFETDSPEQRDNAYRSWIFPQRQLIRGPEATCPGMNEAAVELAAALAAGTKMAVFCDYDVDGTSAGAVLARGLAPYLQTSDQLLYGYADAKRGFGLTNEFVEQAAASGAEYLLTLDCGSGQVEQVKLAQQLGMKVVVVDHHTTERSKENPAEYHLNPHLYEGAWTKNTGSQLAWKLAAAVQMADEPDGKTRPEHWQEALYLAGAGMLADMGDITDHENRAFIWCARESVPPGIAELADRLGEDPGLPGQTVLTQAVLNLPKRSPLVEAADVGAILNAESREAARPYVDRIVEQYERANPVRKQLVEIGIEKAGGAAVTNTESGDVYRPRPEEPIALVVLDPSDLPDGSLDDYVGYTGPVAQRISDKVAKPTLVFLPRGTDEFGQTLYKFSGRDASKGDGWLGVENAAKKLGPKVPWIAHRDTLSVDRFVAVEEQASRLGPFGYSSPKKVKIGELIADPQMQAACLIKRRDEAGAIVEAPSIGGHAGAPVVSGTCTVENIPVVKAAVESWARRVAAEVNERPKASMAAKAFQPLVAIEATFHLVGPDSDNERYLVGRLDLGEGVEREVRYPADAAAPPEHACEWLVKLGKPAPYYLRHFHDHEAVAA